MKKPFLADDPVIGIAAAKAKVTDVDACSISFGHAFHQFISRLQAAALIAEADEPRACRATLDIALRKGSGIGEPAAVAVEIQLEVAVFAYQFSGVKSHAEDIPR